MSIGCSEISYSSLLCDLFFLTGVTGDYFRVYPYLSIKKSGKRPPETLMYLKTSQVSLPWDLAGNLNQISLWLDAVKQTWLFWELLLEKAENHCSTFYLRIDL